MPVARHLAQGHRMDGAEMPAHEFGERILVVMHA